MTLSIPAGTAIKTLPRILCVDDEQAVVDALARQLHALFEVTGVTSGAAALGLLEATTDFAVLVCDMRMPEMDGAEVLTHARSLRPDTTRILLTGQTDLSAAIAAVNRGNIFRFLTKPCSGAELRAALNDAVALHRAVTAERELLEQTLRGRVAALTDALALANPVAFARATRIQALVRHLIEALQPQDAWQIEVAAMLAQLGTVVLAPETVDKLHRGLPLEDDERAQVDELPRLSDRLLSSIPRLEAVRQIIRNQQVPYARCRYGEPRSPIALGGQMLRVATALEHLEAGGVARRNALGALARDVDDYDPELLARFIEDAGDDGVPGQPRPVAAADLQVGWRIEADVYDGSGRLIISRGYIVTESLLERLGNWRGPAFAEPIFVTPDAID